MLNAIFGENVVGSISAKVTYSDINMQTAKENLVITLGLEERETEEKMEYEYTLNTTKTFTDNFQIEPITSQNAVILNNTSEEYRKQIMNILMLKIAQINKEQMTKLELREDENPIFYALPIGFATVQMNSLINQSVDAANQLKQAQKEEEEKANEIMKNLDETVKNTINAKFIEYQGIQNGSKIKSLLSTVISNNLSSEIAVSVNGMKDQYKITNYMNNIEVRKDYNVNLKANQYGYINEIEIKENS